MLQQVSLLNISICCNPYNKISYIGHSINNYKVSLQHMEYLPVQALKDSNYALVIIVAVLYCCCFITAKENHGAKFYAKAVNEMRSIVAKYNELFKKYDVIIMPTIKCKAPKIPLSNVLTVAKACGKPVVEN